MGIDYFLFRSFQQAVLKNMNERNAQLQKQLDNVIREGEYMHLARSIGLRPILQ